MPNYTYGCNKCNHTFDELYLMADRKTPESEPCPKCGKKAVKHIVGGMTIGDAVRMGIKRPDASFQAKLKAIADRHNNGNLTGHYGDNITEF